MRQRTWEENEQIFVVVLAGRNRKGSAKVINLYHGILPSNKKQETVDA